MRVQHLSAADRLEVKAWDYSQELDTYSREEIAADNPTFFAVYDGNSFIGFGVTGFDAIVQGMELNSIDLDVGLGMAPHLVGNGRGTEFGQAVLAHATKLAKRDGLDHLRCAIRSWNTIPQKMATTARFEPADNIVNSLGEFIILRRAIA
jgi:hypothetical protein